MGNILPFYRNRMLSAHQMRRRVDEYELSNTALREMKNLVLRARGSIYTEDTQRILLENRRQGEYTWHDIVFYATNLYGMHLKDLIPELRGDGDESNKTDRDFARLCRRRRIRMEKSNT